MPTSTAARTRKGTKTSTRSNARAFTVAAPKTAFRDAAASDARLVATANEFGLIKDVPLCRWSMHLLPRRCSGRS